MPDRETLLALRERLVKAEGADQDLDANLMLGLGLLTRANRLADCPEEQPIWEYFDAERNALGTHSPMVGRLTDSMDAAIALFGRALPGWSRESGRSGFGNPAWCRAWNPLKSPGEGNSIRAEHSGGFEPIAILIALIDALTSEPSHVE